MADVLEGMDEPTTAPPRPLVEEAVVEAERDCIETDWYDLYVEVENELGETEVKKARAPTREEITRYFAHDDFGETMLFQFRTQGEKMRTVWQTWAGADPTIYIFGNESYKRFYTWWRAMETSHWYDGLEVQMRFCKIPEEIADISNYHGEENCAIAVLSGLYKSKSWELKKMRLEADGGFRYKQAMEAAKIVKRNVELRNQLGHTIYLTKRDDGTPLYQGKTKGKTVPPIVLYSYDQHAVAEMPARPDVKKLDVVPVEYSTEDYWAVKGYFGPLAKLWPLGGEAAVVERWMDTPLLIRSEARYEAVKARAEELGVDEYKLIGSPFGVEVKAWTRQNGFEPTVAYKELWQAANFYPIPYSNLKVKIGKTVDLNSAYESCAVAGGAAADLLEQYGFPSSEGMIAVRSPPEEVLERTGMVVAVLDLDKCHPWVQYLARGAPRGAYTTMRLKAWKDAGAVVIVALELAVIAKKRRPACARPEGARWTPPNAKKGLPFGKELSPKEGDSEKKKAKKKDQLRHWGRQAIGRLIPNPENGSSFSYVYSTSQAEAGSMVHGLISEGRLGSYEYVRKALPPAPAKSHEEVEAEIISVLEELCGTGEQPEAPEHHFDEFEGYHKIGIREDGAKNSCYHAHAYFLDYTAIVVDREIFRHPWESIARVATDCITLAEGHEFSSSVRIGTGVGEWKVAKHKKIEYDQFKPRPELPDLALFKAVDYWEPLLNDAPTVFEGPPGYGKTYHCLSRLEGVDHVVLTPTRKMRRAILRDSPAPGRHAFTWHWALKPGKKFDPVLVKVSRGSILYFPEIGTWDAAIAKEIIPWLIEHHGCTIIADGDRRQMAPAEGESPWRWLDAVATFVPWFGTDHRSKTPELAAFKMKLRELRTNRAVFNAITAAIGETYYEGFLEEWHPRDYVYCARLTTRTRITEDLCRVHREKYANALVRIRYGEANKSRCGEEEYIPLGAPVPATADVEYVSTYSSCQGETASADENKRLPKVWLVDNRVTEFFANAVYVGATRVEQMAQLGVVVNPPLSPEELAKQDAEFGQYEVMDLAELE